MFADLQGDLQPTRWFLGVNLSQGLKLGQGSYVPLSWTCSGSRPGVVAAGRVWDVVADVGITCAADTRLTGKRELRTVDVAGYNYTPQVKSVACHRASGGGGGNGGSCINGSPRGYSVSNCMLTTSVKMALHWTDRASRMMRGLLCKRRFVSSQAKLHLYVKRMSIT